jgi:hypothetical protein
MTIPVGHTKRTCTHRRLPDQSTGHQKFNPCGIQRFHCIHNDFNCYKGDKNLWSIKLTMGKWKPHIVSVVETGMNVIKANSYSSVIRNAFAKHDMFEKIRGPVRQLIAATDNLYLDFVPTEEEVNDKAFIMRDDEEEGEMSKVLCDDDDSDDHSAMQCDATDQATLVIVNVGVFIIVGIVDDARRKSGVCKEGSRYDCSIQGNTSIPCTIFIINARINSKIFCQYFLTCTSCFTSDTNSTCSEAQSSNRCSERIAHEVNLQIHWNDNQRYH